MLYIAPILFKCFEERPKNPTLQQATKTLAFIYIHAQNTHAKSLSHTQRALKGKLTPRMKVKVVILLSLMDANCFINKELEVHPFTDMLRKFAGL